MDKVCRLQALDMLKNSSRCGMYRNSRKGNRFFSRCINCSWYETKEELEAVKKRIAAVKSSKPKKVFGAGNVGKKRS